LRAKDVKNKMITVRASVTKELRRSPCSEVVNWIGGLEMAEPSVKSGPAGHRQPLGAVVGGLRWPG